MAEILYLNKVLVDLKGKIVTRKIQIGDVGDVASRKSTFSYSIKLVRTSKTVQLLDMIGAQGNTSRKPFELIIADYIVDGIALVSNGYAKIKSTGEYIEINIFDGVKELSERLKGLKLSDLPLDDLSHYLTSQEYIDSFSNAEGFIYCIADYGLGATANIKVEKQAPSIFQHTIFRKIFETAGLNLVGEFFTTNQKYLNEVITPSKGYEITDAAFTSTLKGSASTDTLSSYQHSGSYIYFYRKFTFTTAAIVGASIVSGNLVFNVAGTYKINIVTSSSSYETFLNLEFQVNGESRAVIALEEGSNKTKNTSIIFAVEVGDVVSLYLSGSSYYIIDEGGIFDPFAYSVSYSASCSSTIYLQEGGQLIKAVDYIGELNQIDFIKDVIQRYGLVLRPISNSSDFEFKRLEVLLNDRASAEDWTSKLKEIKNESYISGYAKTNQAKYKYPQEIVIPNNDGEMIIDNENAESEKTLFTSVFEVPNTAGTLAGETIYSVPVFELKNAVVQLKETPLKIMSIKRVTTNIYAKLFEEVTSVDASENIPFLSLETMSLNYYISNFYKAFKSLINNYKEIEAEFNLSVIDIYNLNFFKLKFLKQTGRFYYLDTVTNTPNKVSKVKMIEISEFPTNEPPSQVGNFEFNMNHDSTRTITLNNLLTGYEDPEEDAALKIKIISGFSNDLIMKQAGVTITTETEILASELNLTVFDSLGGLEGYSNEFIFTIADVGSGQYSAQTGIIKANVLSFTNFPPVANAGADITQELPPEFITEDDSVFLNGSASYDDTGEITSYKWSIISSPSGSTVYLNSTEELSIPTNFIVLPNQSENVGTYIIELTVTDEFGATDTDTVTVIIQASTYI